MYTLPLYKFASSLRAAPKDQHSLSQQRQRLRPDLSLAVLQCCAPTRALSGECPLPSRDLSAGRSSSAGERLVASGQPCTEVIAACWIRHSTQDLGTHRMTYHQNPPSRLVEEAAGAARTQIVSTARQSTTATQARAAVTVMPHHVCALITPRPEGP